VTGPLDEDTANPRRRLLAEAERTYAELVEKGEIELRWSYQRHALLEGGDPDLVVEDELKACAKREGRELEWSRNDDIGYTVYLVEPGRERRGDRCGRRA
jgi:hypothetical protein